MTLLHRQATARAIERRRHLSPGIRAVQPGTDPDLAGGHAGVLLFQPGDDQHGFGLIQHQRQEALVRLAQKAGHIADGDRV